jgi:hypothetical protein
VDTSVLLAYDFVAKLWILLLFRKRSGGQLLAVAKDRDTYNPRGEPERLSNHTHPTRNPWAMGRTRTISAVEMPKFLMSLSYLRQN